MLKIVSIACCIIFAAYSGPRAFSQSQALDAQIEGFVYDQNGAVIPRASVTATNTLTGFVRSVLTDEAGFYRMPLMPLGTYRLVVEPPRQMGAVRDGVTIVTGQTATINFTVSPGEIVDSVTVSADSLIADPGKTDLGRVIAGREGTALPLVSMNPHNFVLQQANVNGRPSRGFNFPNISANGYLRRVNYLIDGNAATQADRAGVRLVQIAGIHVKEVQLISNAFAPEFGNTPGTILNAVTPSGTNQIDGSVAFLFRLPSFYSRPFSYTSPVDLPDNRAAIFSGRVGLPIVKDRWHIYGGYEPYVRDDSALPNRLLSLSKADVDRLIAAGLSPSIFPPAIPTRERGRFTVFRSDTKFARDHRLAIRLNESDGVVENNLQGTMANGTTNTLERSIDLRDENFAAAGQLVSYSNDLVNELRVQFAGHKISTHANEFSGSGPSIVILNLINFGSPENAGSIDPLEKQMQVQNNLTLVRGAHIAKFGGGFVRIMELNRADVYSRYTFQTLEAYLLARSGADPYSYSRYDESSGDPERRFRATYWNFFAQDDWKVTDRLKLVFGLRYDLFALPEADPDAAYEGSRKFRTDKNNFAPRVAAAFAFREGSRPTVLRVGAGLYYEPPWLDMYERALRKNGNPRYFNFSVRSPLPAWAPAFPSTFPPGLQLSTQDIDAVSPDLENLYAIHANVQVEQAITDDVSVTVGYVHSGGRHIAVYRSTNFIPVSSLPDGRPVFSLTSSPETRYDPRYNNILIAESTGTSRYDALTIQFNVRSWRNVHLFANYTLSKATDDAPEQNIALPNPTNSVLSNPFDRGFDRGRSYADQRHTFAMSIVARPRFNIGNGTLRRIFNNNQFGVIMYANSGQAFNIISANHDLNQDGLRQDRPLGVARNSGTTPPLFNVDFRYSRFVTLGERYRLEFLAEFTNLFNVNSIVQFNNTGVTTDSSGQMIGGMPDFRARNQSTSQESRQTQLGLRFHF